MLHVRASVYTRRDARLLKELLLDWANSLDQESRCYCNNKSLGCFEYENTFRQVRRHLLLTAGLLLTANPPNCQNSCLSDYHTGRDHVGRVSVAPLTVDRTRFHQLTIVDC